MHGTQNNPIQISLKFATLVKFSEVKKKTTTKTVRRMQQYEVSLSIQLL